jgi:hypothetical protein
MVGLVMCDKLEIMRKEAVVGYLRYYSGISLEGPRKTTRPSVRIAAFLAEI